MKPENAMKLPINSDLANPSIDEAIILLNAASQKMRFGHFSLRIPSQLVEMAMILAVAKKIGVYLDCSYEPDEWSLRISGIEDGKSGAELRQYEVWSPGA